MLNLTIGGVPEHFNYPWYLTLKNKAYAECQINLRWKDFFGGSGEMNQALRNGETDIAIILTEGIIKDINEGNPSKIVQTFVKSPLIWGIHVAAHSQFQTIADLKDATVAISRYGSGSHLMAIVNAYNQGWDINDIQFKEVADLEGGIAALSNGDADYFMWEHFTTKPLVDNGTFRLVGDCLTPWPCFVIAVRNEVLEQHSNAIKKILTVINATTASFKSTPKLEETLAIRYEQKIEDVREWLSLTEWESNIGMKEENIETIQNQLLLFGVMNEKMPEKDIIFNF